MDPQYGPLSSLEGPELWAPVLKVACNGVIMGLKDSELGAIRGP